MKPNQHADTVFKNRFLVDFVHIGESTNSRVLRGIVVEDLKARWNPGEFCCQSLVLKKLESHVIRTKWGRPDCARNNQYKLENNWPNSNFRSGRQNDEHDSIDYLE